MAHLTFVHNARIWGKPQIKERLMSKKKDKSDILSGMGSGFQIIKALRDAGASDDQLRTIIANGSALPDQIVALLKGANDESQSGGTYSVTIDYSKSLAQMIVAGKYDYANPDIVEKNFPIQRPNASEGDIQSSGNPYRTLGIQNDNNTEIVLVHLKKVVTTTEVLAHMDKLGLRPARIEELLAFGEKYPKKQLEFPIVALGSVWVYSDQLRHVACLDRNGSERDLNLDWGNPAYAWSEVCRFAAVSK
ncbi:MAG: Uncharacterized protein G01um101413_959 [Parcubacteria group bacterium Gr01-1014_13]|nr:MAG: Uncharacterized protein G01um101413_959 [Parcubacteria group bacterium Gr01-1014_13]